MRNFIARMGYILTWGLVIPVYSLEEAFEEYYIFGLLITIVGISSMVFIIVCLIVILFRKGVETTYIQPQTKDYWGLKDVVHELKWEDYPEPSGYDENDNPYYLICYGDIWIVFDDFKESWN